MKIKYVKQTKLTYGGDEMDFEQHIIEAIESIVVRERVDFPKHELPNRVDWVLTTLLTNKLIVIEGEHIYPTPSAYEMTRITLKYKGVEQSGMY